MAKKRRVTPGRRSLIAVALVGFVAVTTIVIGRRVWGVRQQTEIRKLQQKRDALDADRIRLDGEIRDASSRATLQPIAEQRLNMHIATPSEQVFLPRSTVQLPGATRSPRAVAQRDSL